MQLLKQRLAPLCNWSIFSYIETDRKKNITQFKTKEANDRSLYLFRRK